MQEVLTALEELGLDCETEYSADSLEYSVDLALPEQRIAIEVRPRCTLMLRRILCYLRQASPG